MDKQDLIQEFEAYAARLTAKNIKKLENSDAQMTSGIFDEFQKSVASETSKIIQKAILNNVDDRISIITRLAEIAVEYAEKLKSSVQ